MAKSSPLVHFELPSNTKGNYKGKCKYCGASISGSEKTSLNFTTHMRVSVFIDFTIDFTNISSNSNTICYFGPICLCNSNSNSNRNNF